MRFSRPQLQDALRRLVQPALSEFTLEVGELISPTIPLITALDDTPYLRYATPCGFHTTQSAVAAEFGYVFAQPGADVVLQILQITLLNQSAATNEYNVNLLTAANVATIGVAARVFLANLAAPSVGGLVSSSLARGTDASAVIGMGIDSRRIPAGQSSTIVFPRPGVFLFGNDGGGIPGLAVVNLTANDPLKMSVTAREWPLPV